MSWVLDLASHRSATEDWVPVFGVLVYTDTHANVKKMLRDDDYWAALDEVSGPVWAVFSVRALQGEWEMPRPPPGVVGLMQPVWKEPAANKELLEAFELRNTKDLPALVVFATVGEELYQTAVKIDDSTVEGAYSSLKSALLTVSTAIERVRDTDRGDLDRILGAVERALRRERMWKRVRDAYRVLRELRGWLPV